MNIVNEIWKPIYQFRGINYQGKYEISNIGNVRSLDRIIQVDGEIHKGFNKKLKGRMLPVKIDGNGYLSAVLNSRYKSTAAQIHRLICIHFIDNPNNYPIINHKDGNKLNNSIDNLEWCTYSHNLTHAIHTGLHKCEKPVNQICPLTNNVLATFRSITDAERKTGIERKNISAVCRGKRPAAGGYNWEYDTKIFPTIMGD